MNLPSIGGSLIQPDTAQTPASALPDSSEKFGGTAFGSFADAVAYLSEIAKGLTENETGLIRVSVHGLDVSDPKANRSKSRKDGVARVKPQSGKPAKALAPKKVVPKRGGRAQ